MATEDDTFRMLSRPPLSEVYPIVQKKVIYTTRFSKLKEIVETFGYSLDEFFAYEQEKIEKNK